MSSEGSTWCLFPLKRKLIPFLPFGSVMAVIEERDEVGNEEISDGLSDKAKRMHPSNTNNVPGDDETESTIAVHCNRGAWPAGTPNYRYDLLLFL